MSDVTEATADDAPASVDPATLPGAGSETAPGFSDEILLQTFVITMVASVLFIAAAFIFVIL